MKKKGQIQMILIVILFLISVIGLFLYQGKIKSLENENKLYIVILKADSEFSKISLDSQEAESYYSEASYFYESQDFKLVESNCRLARDAYSKEVNGYKNLKAELLSYEIEDKLIDIYIDSLDSLIEIGNSMYEACEHFESAVRYYDKYYSAKVWDDSDYKMGTGEIEIMNEKIDAHDIAIERYNQQLEDFRVELEKRLKNEK